MATVLPFAALRPRPEDAGTVCELPYDVMSTEEARVIAGDNRLSFLRISKPEINFAGEVDLHAPEVYAKGRELFDRFVREGVLRQDDRPGYYFYRLTMGRHRQTGLVATASCEEYRQGVVRRHELTRPDKEDDRVRHMEGLDAQTGPAFLTYRASEILDTVTLEVTQDRAQVDFVAPDGVRHEGWAVYDSERIEAIRKAFGELERLYIADGHHRSAAASRVDIARGGRGGSDRFLAVIFPHDQMQILPYHRVVTDLNGLTTDAFLGRLSEVCDIESPGDAAPVHRHAVGLYLGRGWHTLRFKAMLLDGLSEVEQLDVALLQRLILQPLLGIEDPRTSQRIQFVGGVRGTKELERLVLDGRGACAFSMFPTSMEELMSVADGGGIMPPKSTWFEPKLRDGLFVHRLER